MSKPRPDKHPARPAAAVADEPQMIRRSVTLPDELWRKVDAYRRGAYARSNNEAVRRLLEDALLRLENATK